MITFRFSVTDMARTRFAISPMWELVRSLVALREPSTAAMHLPWLRSLSGRLDGLDLRSAVALVLPRGYTPDFLTPPPSTPLGDIATELAAIRATSADQIRREISLVRARQGPSSVLDRWLDDPRREADRLADTLTEYWARALEPAWPRIRALLEADLAHRARRLTERGPAGLFADLDAGVRWSDGTLTADVTCEDDVDLAGRGLLLMPSAFTWMGACTITDEPWLPTLVYPARGVATLWEEPQVHDLGGLARVVGTTRAELLARLDAPHSTAELARMLGITSAGVSQHLSALRGAGLVTKDRAGRTVLYMRTPQADGLVPGATRTPAAEPAAA